MKNKSQFKLLLLILLTISIQSLWAQKNLKDGYIINLKGDTVRGMIDYQEWQKNPKKIKFSKTQGDELIQYTPLDIKAFYISGELYESHIIDIDKSPFRTSGLVSKSELVLTKDTVFLRLLVRGSLDLAYLLDNDEKHHFFVRGTDVELSELINRRYLVQSRSLQGMHQTYMQEDKKYLGQLTYYLRACESASRKASKVDYKKEALIELIRSYHSCVSGEIMDEFTYSKKKERASLKIGIIGGISVTSVNAFGNAVIDNAEFNNSSVAPFFGASFQIILARNRKKWKIVNDLIYRSYSFEGISENYNVLISNEKSELTFNAGHVELATLIRYDFLAGNIRPFLNIGLSNSFLASISSEQIETIPSSSVNKKNELFPEQEKYRAALIYGAGVQFSRMSFEIRYEKHPGITPATINRSPTTPTKAFFFQFSYYF